MAVAIVVAMARVGHALLLLFCFLDDPAEVTAAGILGHDVQTVSFAEGLAEPPDRLLFNDNFAADDCTDPDDASGSVADLSNFDMHNHPLAREALASVLGQLGVGNPAELEPRERAIRYASRAGKRSTVARGLLRCLLRGR